MVVYNFTVEIKFMAINYYRLKTNIRWCVQRVKLCL